jgi:hypothetical protein
MPLVPIRPTLIRSLGGTVGVAWLVFFDQGNDAVNAAPATAAEELRKVLREVIVVALLMDVGNIKIPT